MIDLSRPVTSLHLVYRVPSDPGRDWVCDQNFSIDAPPDGEIDPAPEARWPADAVRTGICGAVAPRVLMLPDGGYRMYYSQMVPRPGHPLGALDYENCQTRILSAYSPDGFTWNPESGVRLAPSQCGANVRRVVSSEVVPVALGDPRLRMYFECCAGLQTEPSAILSAISDDGLNWTVEPGERIGDGVHNYMSSRILWLADGRCRLFCCQRDTGIISAISEDGGTNFTIEPGVRVGMETEHDALVAFACEIVSLDDGTFIMYYAGYDRKNIARILRAVSDDGFNWRKETKPVISPGGCRWDAAKSSEMCIYRLPQAGTDAARYGMVYEACDGTGQNNRGVWRIAGARSV